MEILKLPSEVSKARKHKRSANRKKNRNAYAQLKYMLVPNIMSLAQFRKSYHPVLSVKEKEILLKMGIDPWSVEGLKYVGDCKRQHISLGEQIPGERFKK